MNRPPNNHTSFRLGASLSSRSIRPRQAAWTVMWLVVTGCLHASTAQAQYSLKSSEASGQTTLDQSQKLPPELSDPALAPWLRYPATLPATLPTPQAGQLPSTAPSTASSGSGTMTTQAGSPNYGVPGSAVMQQPLPYSAYPQGVAYPPGYVPNPYTGYPPTGYAPGYAVNPAALGNALPNTSVVTDAPGTPSTFLPPGAPGGTFVLPVQPQRPTGPLEIHAHNQLVTIYAQDVDLRQVLNNLSTESGVNIVVAENVTGRVTTALRDVPLWHALDAVLKVNGLVWSQQGDIVFVNRPNNVAVPISTSMPGQLLQIYELNYVSGKEVLDIVKGLLSPGGRAFTHAANINSSRQTRERLIVEDYPDRLQKIAHYIQVVDTPPRQVLIEANVLQVSLTNEDRHGVNLDALARVAGAKINVIQQGFADNTTNPGFMIGLDSTDMKGLLECLKSNSRVRTLASPKVLVVNGQEARIQIGAKFGYFVTTTTQTATLQNVNFLDIGTVQQVKPIITQDNQVLLTVQPKVSDGRINPSTKLPEEETTEATTTVLMPNGRGMIIGGLIKESDNESESMIPWLGERPFIGRLFRKWSFKKQRVEVIIALTPHIVPFNDPILSREAEQFVRAGGLVTEGDVVCVTPEAELSAPRVFDPQSSPTSIPGPITYDGAVSPQQLVPGPIAVASPPVNLPGSSMPSNSFPGNNLPATNMPGNFAPSEPRQ
ncbi:MAG: hypothetical protein U0892_00135 [Pirellulales bacterium]